MTPATKQIGTPAPRAIMTPSKVLPHHLIHLRESGLTDATIAAAGIHSETRPARLGELLDWATPPKKLAPAIVFPFPNLAGETNYYRIRPDSPRIEKKNGRPVKYESPRNRDNQIYIPPGVAAVLPDATRELIFSEGEKKALSASQINFPTVGLVGVFGWKQKKSERLLPVFDQIPFKDREVYVVFDSDLSDKPEVADAENRFAKHLTDRGAKVKCCRLPGGPNGEKVGLDDYLLAAGENARRDLRQLLNEAVEPEPINPSEFKEPASEADPATEAEDFLTSSQIDGVPQLRFWRGGFLWWSQGRFLDVQNSEVKARLIEFLNENYSKLTTGITANVFAQVIAKSLLPFGHNPPCWIGDSGGWSPRDLVVARNGIINLNELAAGGPDYLRPATPKFFTTAALDYDFVPDAPPPDAWLEFLSQVFARNTGNPDSDDIVGKDSIELLQEWFGYSLVPDTSQQKILLIVGPPRSGKGTIARVLRRVIGEYNTAGPTLASLATNFGLWPLVGKLLAIVSDARLGNRTDQAAVVERLLSISGEDALTIDRKNLEPITTRLLSRIVILSNELPRVSDSSGALANRFLVLRMGQSFLGREDAGLTDRLLAERSSILRWAIQGWQRLRSRGRLVQPESGKELWSQLEDLASPVTAFVRERCNIDQRHRTDVTVIYAEWCDWCEREGRREPGSRQVFGRDLVAAFPSIRCLQQKEKQERWRAYDGIGLKNN